MRHEVPRAFDNALVDDMRQDRALSRRDLCRPPAEEAIVASVKDNRWRRDRRPLRQLSLDVGEPRLPRGVEIAMAVGVDHASDKIRILE
jgi:hypothetical protein